MLPRLFAEQAPAEGRRRPAGRRRRAVVPERRAAQGRSRSGRTSTSTRSSRRRRCGPSRATCACRATSGSILDAAPRRAEGEGDAGVQGSGREARRAHHRRAQRRLERAKKLAANKGKPGEIDPHYLFAELNKVLEARRHRVQRRRRQRRRCCCSSTGRSPTPACAPAAAGSAGPAAWRSAPSSPRPSKMVVQVVGDGGFYFGGPCSVFAVAQQYKLPILVLLLDNTGWSAVKESTLRVFPGGRGQGGRRVQAELMPDCRLLQGRRGVRRLWREGHQSGRRAGGDRALRQGGPRRPLGDAARARDEDVDCSCRAGSRHPVSRVGVLNVMIDIRF